MQKKSDCPPWQIKAKIKHDKEKRSLIIKMRGLKYMISQLYISLNSFI